MIKNSALILILIFLSPFIWSQNEEVIHGFKAEVLNAKVLLTWSITQGNTCNGVQILRSNNGEDFFPIGSIEGICGSSAESISYEFTDLFPVKNAVNYYRLSLGGIGLSVIIGIEIVEIGSNNYLLRPNPVVGQSELHFKNEVNKEILLRVFSPNGAIVWQETTTGNVLFIRNSNFEAGMYYFTLKDVTTESELMGKFLIH